MIWVNGLIILQNCARGVTVDKRTRGAHCSAMIVTTLYVALGGAIGAALRFWVGVGVLRLFGMGSFMGVAVVNAAGSFLMGLAAVYITKNSAPYIAPFVMTGILGGFTTFSAFSYDAVILFEKGAMGQAALYVVLSVTLSIAALCFGLWTGRGLWA